MAKLHLKLEQLDVESFETSGTRAEFGTVRANEGTQPIDCGESDLVSCGGSCDFTSCDDHTCYGCGGQTGSLCPTRNQPTCVQTAPAPETCCQITC